MSSIRNALALGAAVSILAASPSAWAEAGGAEVEPMAAPGGYGEVPPAVAHYQRAQELYEQGRYQDAARELERAVELDPGAPELLYNLALVYERLSEFDRAIAQLDRYLEFEITEEERGRVEGMLTRLRGAREHQPDDPEPETRTRVVVRRFGLADGVFWGFLGTAIAVGAAAVGTGASAMLYGNEADNFVVGQHGGSAEYQWLFDTSTGLALATDVLIGLASAAAVTAILLYALRERPAEEREHEEPVDEWGPPPGSSRTSGGEAPEGSDWGPAPESGDDGEGAGDDWGAPPPAADDDGGSGSDWGPPPEGATAPRSRGRGSIARALMPQVAVGIGTFMIGWEL